MPRQRERNAIPVEPRTAAEGYVRFAMKIAYDGTDYQGFQSQAHGNTIQDAIETRLEKLVRRPVRILGWGRTDSGVHASGAVITVDLSNEEVKRIALTRDRTIEKETIEEMSQSTARLLTSALKEFGCHGGPGSITALSSRPVPSDFDPRFSTRRKTYVYYVSFDAYGGTKSPFLNRFCWQINRQGNVATIAHACELLSGWHNFAWLSVTQEGESRDPVRNLSLTVESVHPGPFGCGGVDDASKPPSLVKISGTCDFFLYRMMRRIVGVLVGIGIGQVDMDLLKSILATQDGGKSSDGTIREGISSRSSIPDVMRQTAPSKGLYLEHIEYDISI